MEQTEQRLLEPTFGRAIKVWWAFFWRSVLLAVAVSMVLGFIIGLVFGLIGIPQDTIQRVGAFAGFIAGIAASVYCMQMILAKNFGEFQVVLLSRDASNGEDRRA